MKIYKSEAEKEKKEIPLTLYSGRDVIYLTVVSQYGTIMAKLLGIGAKGIYLFDGIREDLESAGYDTSELAWDENGAIKVVTK